MIQDMIIGYLFMGLVIAICSYIGSWREDERVSVEELIFCLIACLFLWPLLLIKNNEED